MSKQKLFTIFLFSVIFTSQAFATEFALTSEKSKTRIVISQHPGSKDSYLVGWSDFSDVEPKEGVMVYSMEKGTNESRYFAHGGGGLFTIYDKGGKTLEAGSVVSLMSIVTTEPNHPLIMKLGKPDKGEVEKLLERYHQFENVAPGSESKTGIEAALNLAKEGVNKDCGSKLALKVNWSSFGDKKMMYAKQAQSILEGLKLACKDADYKEAIAKMKTLEVNYTSEYGNLKIERALNGLKVHLGEGSFNPRESIQPWLTTNL